MASQVNSFIWGCGENLFTQLYTWAACREPCTKLGMNGQERIVRLHCMHLHRNLLFRGIFLGQCTLKLISLTLRHLRPTYGAQEALPLTKGRRYSRGLYVHMN